MVTTGINAPGQDCSVRRDQWKCWLSLLTKGWWTDHPLSVCLLQTAKRIPHRMTPYPYLKNETDLSLCAHCLNTLRDSLFLRNVAGDEKWVSSLPRTVILTLPGCQLCFVKENRPMGSRRCASGYFCSWAPCPTNDVNTNGPAVLNCSSSGTKKRFQHPCPKHPQLRPSLSYY